LTKKRRGGGRSGGSKGRAASVQCDNCGRQVPADKVKKKTRYVSVVDPRMSKELRDAGAILPRRQETSNFCVSCAVHFKQVRVRSKDSRKSHLEE
jgi:small subunit ribosomal protein S26e